MSLELHAKAILEDPGDLSLKRMKGLTLYNLGRYEESLEVYDKVLEASPRIEPYVIDVSALEGKGDALRALNRNQEALEAYNEAIALAPSSSAAWHGKGEAEGIGTSWQCRHVVLVDKLGYENDLRQSFHMNWRIAVAVYLQPCWHSLCRSSCGF